LQLTPEDGEALFGRASALLHLQQRLEEAITDFDRAAERGIERPETLVGKAAALAVLRRHGEAAACLSELLTLAPTREYVRGSWLHSRLQICDWVDLDAQVEQLTELVRQGRRVTHPQSLLSLSDSPELHLTCARLFVEEKYPSPRSLEPRPTRVVEGRQGRIRVAYVSADFREHPVSYLLVGALERHDRRRFEVVGVSLRVGEGSPFESRVRSAFDRFIEVSDLGDQQVARLLRELQVDIAVDLMGLTEGLRLGIFAHRAAPVQVTYLGYAGTLGAPYVDYLLADEVVIPSGQESDYKEQVVRLPHCYLPNDDRRQIGARPTRAQAGLPEQGLVFCAFTSTYKINAPMFGIWMRLLREVEGSVLWLREMTSEARINLEREAQQHGVAASRLVYAPHAGGIAEHLGRHALADLYLDTFPYNAHSTACDALWVGVPVLTCAGRSFASRVAASALTAVGLPELITNDLREYENKALELGRDPQQLQALHARLAQNRLSSPLFDTVRFTQNLESAYDIMHERAKRGEAPHSFAVERSVRPDVP
jgi:protein O-GlcNAc transferase